MEDFKKVFTVCHRIGNSAESDALEDFPTKGKITRRSDGCF